MVNLKELLRKPFYKIYLPTFLITLIAPYPLGILFNYQDNRREYNNLVSLVEQVRQKAQGEGDFTPEKQLNFLEQLGHRNFFLMDEKKKQELWLMGLVGSNFKSPIAQYNGLFVEGIELARFGVSSGYVDMGIKRLLGEHRRTPPKAYVSMGENALTYVDKIYISKEEMEGYLAKK